MLCSGSGFHGLGPQSGLRTTEDLPDVLRLVETTKLPREFSATLDPYVRAKYDELWHSAQHPNDDY